MRYLPVHTLAYITAVSLFAATLVTTSQAATLEVLVGDQDGVGGIYAGLVPGDSINANLLNTLPTIAPGNYSNQAATDSATVDPYTPYLFTFDFPWDTTNFTAVDSAVIEVQAASVGKRNDGSGFGYAAVAATDGIGSQSLGDFSTDSTGASGSPLEEQIRLHAFDVSVFVPAGATGTLTLEIDGSALNAPVDLFALDFARLTITGTQVPEPASAVLLVGLLAGTAAAGRLRRH